MFKRLVSLTALVCAYYLFDFSLFDVSEWRLVHSDYFTEISKKWSQLLRSPRQLLNIALCIALVIIGLRGFILPVIKNIISLTPQVIGQISSSYQPQITKLKAWFSTGADVIEKGSMWLLLISLIFYLFNDRESSAITGAWEAIDRAQGKWGDLGRRDALSTLIDYDVSLIGIDLSYASLNYLEFDDEHDDYDVDPDRPMLDLVSLNHSDISYASFPCVFMRQANLQWAILSGTRFTGADLRDSDFLGSDFGGTATSNNLHVITDFSFSDLRGANLGDAPNPEQYPPSPYIRYLSNIQPSGAWLMGADLRGATIGRKVLGLDDIPTPDQLNFALENLKTFTKWDHTTQFPTIIQGQLNYWLSQEESLESKRRRWDRLTTLYGNSFGESRTERLISYVELVIAAEQLSIGDQQHSISDLTCRRYNEDF